MTVYLHNGISYTARWRLINIENPIVEIKESYNRFISTMRFSILARWLLVNIGNPIVEIRWSLWPFHPTMGFPLLVICYLYIDWEPWYCPPCEWIILWCVSPETAQVYIDSLIVSGELGRQSQLIQYDMAWHRLQQDKIEQRAVSHFSTKIVFLGIGISVIKFVRIHHTLMW